MKFWVTSVVVAAGWMASCRSADTQKSLPQCSSLDGPYCVPINGRPAPLHANGVSTSWTQVHSKASAAGAGDSAIGGLLEKIIQTVTKSDLSAKNEDKSSKGVMEDLVRKLAESLDIHFTGQGSQSNKDKGNGDKTYAKGVFLLHGFVKPPDASGQKAAFHIYPGNWIKKPGPDWVTVGLVGWIYASKSSNELNLQASLMDSEGENLKGCTYLDAKLRTDRPIPNVLTEDFLNTLLSDETIWQGTYSCAGLPTSVTLTLTTLRDEPAAQSTLKVNGKFRFEVTEEARARREAANTLFSLLELGDIRSLLEKTKAHLTEAGCECASEWTEGAMTYKGSRCANPGKKKRTEYCVIIPGTCSSDPAGEDWDYCVENWRELRESKLKVQTFKLTVDGDSPVAEEGELDDEEVVDLLKQAFPDGIESEIVDLIDVFDEASESIDEIEEQETNDEESLDEEEGSTDPEEEEEIGVDDI